MGNINSVGTGALNGPHNHQTTLLVGRVGGPCQLAVAKAHPHGVRRLSIRVLGLSFLTFCAKVFERGVGKTFFKKFSPQSLHKFY